MSLGNQNKVIAGGGAHHIAIQTRDWDASLRLYRDILGMSIVAEFGIPERKIMLLDIGDGSHVELFEPTGDLPPASEEGQPFMHFAFTTTDTRAATEHVRQAGYEVTIAFFKGPSGEELEFFQTH